MKGALMVCGTASSAGKSTFVAGLCRLLSRQGVVVAPFKGQNMALNSFVTSSGHEIGRAQAAQALAARVEPEVAMNPVLLKPSADAKSQVVVMGRPLGTMDAASFYRHKVQLLPYVLAAFDELRERFDVVVAEGAGSPAEVNLPGPDLVNLGLAAERAVPAVLVGDIERGGFFAALTGTVGLLPPRERELLGGYVVNKFRGDPRLLESGITRMGQELGLRHLGTVPYLAVGSIDAEDSLELGGWLRAFDGAERAQPSGGGQCRDADLLDVAVIRMPRLSNFTDFDPLRLESSLAVRLVGDPRLLGVPDLVVLPGTKSTVDDLTWMRRSGMDKAVVSAYQDGSVVLGICGGYQMLGHRIVDGVESATVETEGIGLLDVCTEFAEDKITTQRKGRAGTWCLGSPPVTGYEIHHGRTKVSSSCLSFAVLGWGDEEEFQEGAVSVNRRVYGTSLHGLFESDDFRRAFFFSVSEVRNKRYVPSAASFAEHRDQHFERLADIFEEHCDVTALFEILESAG